MATPEQQFKLENRLTCLILNFRKEKEKYGPTPTQMTLKHR